MKKSLSILAIVMCFIGVVSAEALRIDSSNASEVLPIDLTQDGQNDFLEFWVEEGEPHLSLIFAPKGNNIYFPEARETLGVVFDSFSNLSELFYSPYFAGSFATPESFVRSQSYQNFSWIVGSLPFTPEKPVLHMWLEGSITNQYSETSLTCYVIDATPYFESDDPHLMLYYHHYSAIPTNTTLHCISVADTGLPLPNGLIRVCGTNDNAYLYFTGTIEESPDLKEWQTISPQPTSPFPLNFLEMDSCFWRITEDE